MQDRNAYEDELKRRRALRKQKETEDEAADTEFEDDLPKFGWKDTFALIIAAYQVLFPIILAMVATLGVAYLLFSWYFT